ncbi:PD-(D/E)XK nuclease-like domain-containing protein [Niabella insulamsoli]|uniref:PD-(D/E)XK nuclease-like domain-containing protein n=1 Tax=Niabella insulamsoli TaxID=3144874 RepID=UPI0031FC5B08
MDYYSRYDWVSNSFLKTIMGSEFPPNIDRIFEFGRLVHETILEPEKANKSDKDYQLALKMRDTFYADRLCNSIMSYSNIKVEHEFYRKVSGLKRRCKADGVIKDCSLILEFKGLSSTNEKAFRESITHFDYDMGAAFYIDTTGIDRELIVGVSKKNPEKLFRFMIERGDTFYISGRKKYIKAICDGLLKSSITDQISDPEQLQELINEI